ncbi:MAG: hypothetical protein OEM62_13030, partial [Acidobacteriota bacterium]|nr:hypothetical protein [Acidobacteriota bacterium]
MLVRVVVGEGDRSSRIDAVDGAYRPRPGARPVPGRAERPHLPAQNLDAALRAIIIAARSWVPLAARSL